MYPHSRNAWDHWSNHGLLPAVAITLLACGGETEPTLTSAGPPVSLSISPSRSGLLIGADGQLIAVALDAQGRSTTASVDWSSSSPTIATVGPRNGIVTAVSDGETTVTVAAGDLRATVPVSVEPESLFTQWATGATASTEYSRADWSATKATGVPNVAECVDDRSAWASLSQSGVDWLELTYARPVRPSEIRIYQVWGVGSIVKVEVKDVSGEYRTVYTAQPIDAQPCPRVLIVPISGITTMVSTVRVSIDQRSRFDWDEIDAVRLAGYR